MVGTDGAESRNKVSFSGCRQYSGDSVVRFDEVEPTYGAVDAPAAPRMPTELPAELLIEVSLDETFVLEKAATGDPLQFTVRSDTRRRKLTIIPKGAKIRARVGDIDRRAIRGFNSGVGIILVEVEHLGQIVPLKATVEEGGSISGRTGIYALMPANSGRPAMVYIKSTPPRLPKGLLLQLRVIP